MTVSEAKRALNAAIRHLSAKDKDVVERALETAVKAHEGQERNDGTPYAIHATQVGIILAEWKTDGETIAAGLLHDVLEDSSLTEDDIRNAFGPIISELVVGVTKFTQADFAGHEQLERKIETLRKLFEVMRTDMRVAFIKLADRLHNVRTIDSLPPERRARFAKETLRVYHPIAYHLGIHNLRREFSERCMHWAYPEEAKELDASRSEAMEKLREVQPELERMIQKHNKEGETIKLIPHPRELYALYRRKYRGEELGEFAYCIALTKDKDACYSLLKILHIIFRPISGKFRDYIATKDQNYQSIHTTIVGPNEELVPFRIRTEEMNLQESEGIIRTWFVHHRKEEFPWLRRSEDLDRFTRDSSQQFWEALQADIFRESIQVTVNSIPVHVPINATALDAVYAALGRKTNRTQSLSINGVERSFTAPLEEDAVIQTNRSVLPQVRFEWLDAVTSRYARSLIVESLKERDQTEKLTIGYRLLQHEFDHFQQGLVSDLTRAKRSDVAEHFRRNHFDDVVAMVGEGVLEARDVVFHLFPEKRRSRLFTKPILASRFRIRVTGTLDHQRDVLSEVAALARMHDVTIHSTHLHPEEERKLFELTIHGTTPDRLHFADFLDAIERQEGVSQAVTLMSGERKINLFTSFFLAFAIIVADILLLPFFQREFSSTPFLPSVLLQAIPIIPILAANHYLLGKLQREIIWLRTSRWFLAFGLLINVVGILLLIIYESFTGLHTQSLIPFIAALVFSMFYLGYRFFQTESQFAEHTEIHKQLTAEQWKHRKHEKIIGYLIRLGAVGIWGIQPLYLKYTPANEVEPFVQLFLMSGGALITVLILLAGGFMIWPISKQRVRIPWNIHLFNIVLGQAFFLYFISASLQFTSSTNFALLSNFSPVFALMVAALLWRHSIPYLRDPKHILWIFLIFFMGSAGGSLIIYNSMTSSSEGTALGDILALFAMAFDVLLIISQIRYIKLLPRASSVAINLHIFAFMTAILSPFMLYLFLTKHTSVTSLLLTPSFYSLGAGALLAAGIVMNFEAFRRIDGFIAFLMFNISILINFVGEVFFLGTMAPTLIFVIGAATIISSTILAEIVNSHCERKGL